VVTVVTAVTVEMLKTNIPTHSLEFAPRSPSSSVTTVSICCSDDVDLQGVATLEPANPVSPTSYGFMMAKEKIVMCVSGDGARRGEGKSGPQIRINEE
jgi:hypothetical protein